MKTFWRNVRTNSTLSSIKFFKSPSNHNLSEILQAWPNLFCTSSCTRINYDFIYNLHIVGSETFHVLLENLINASWNSILVNVCAIASWWCQKNKVGYFSNRHIHILSIHLILTSGIGYAHAKLKSTLAWWHVTKQNVFRRICMDYVGKCVTCYHLFAAIFNV